MYYHLERVQSPSAVIAFRVAGRRRVIVAIPEAASISTATVDSMFNKINERLSSVVSRLRLPERRKPVGPCEMPDR
jgi:hypothetical protein